MWRWGRWGAFWGAVCALGLVAIVAWAQTAAPPAKAKLERLKIAVAPLGYDTNFSWLQSLSGQLDKRPALEYLVGIDRNTGAYIPELAETWDRKRNIFMCYDLGGERASFPFLHVLDILIM